MTLQGVVFSWISVRGFLYSFAWVSETSLLMFTQDLLTSMNNYKKMCNLWNGFAVDWQNNLLRCLQIYFILSPYCTWLDCRNDHTLFFWIKYDECVIGPLGFFLFPVFFKIYVLQWPWWRPQTKTCWSPNKVVC